MVGGLGGANVIMKPCPTFFVWACGVTEHGVVILIKLQQKEARSSIRSILKRLCFLSYRFEGIAHLP